MDIKKYVTLENALKWRKLDFFGSIYFVFELLESETKSPSHAANLDRMLYEYAKRNISLATVV